MAVQFATDTGASLSLHDLSVRNLSADYHDHFLDCKSNIRVATINFNHKGISVIIKTMSCLPRNLVV